MAERRRHIVILLAGIFLFPVLFQPWHLIRHHSHEHSGHTCEHKHFPSKTANEVTRITHTQKACYICEFEFAVKDLPDAYAAVGASYKYVELHPDISPAYYQIFEVLLSNPRAPPQF